MSKLLIYTTHATNRIKYTFDLLVADILGLDYELTLDKEFFQQSDRPKFSYDKKPLGNELFFEAAGLLFESVIQDQPIAIGEYENLTGFYLVSQASAIPFDLFSSAFFMVSRYEEYLPVKYDKYDRYRASHSLNYKLEILEKPMVNYYALAIKKLLNKRYPDLKFKEWKFKYIATVDVDMAYSYLQKGLRRNLGGLIRSFIFSQFAEMKERVMVLSKRKPDPFDTYNYILKVCQQYAIPTEFFFLLGDGSRFDKNIDYDNPEFQNLIRQIAAKSKVGIHLSFRSHMASAIMEKEIERLEDITGQKITANRFHYLRFQLPVSYKRLIKLGITEDHSMGYAPHVGFRTGLCTPHYFFDVKANEPTGLVIRPFAFMDTTFAEYYRCQPEQALEKIQQMMRYVKDTGGELIGLWHNSSFTEQGEWKGWRGVFEAVANEASILMRSDSTVETH